MRTHKGPAEWRGRLHVPAMARLSPSLQMRRAYAFGMYLPVCAENYKHGVEYEVLAAEGRSLRRHLARRSKTPQEREELKARRAVLQKEMKALRKAMHKDQRSRLVLVRAFLEQKDWELKRNTLPSVSA